MELMEVMIYSPYLYNNKTKYYSISRNGYEDIKEGEINDGDIGYIKNKNTILKKILFTNIKLNYDEKYDHISNLIYENKEVLIQSHSLVSKEDLYNSNKFIKILKTELNFLQLDIPAFSDINLFGRDLLNVNWNKIKENNDRIIRVFTLYDTLCKLGNKERRIKYHNIAKENTTRICKELEYNKINLKSFYVIEDDWGEVTKNLFQLTGDNKIAVLNMANAIYPGGGYTQGAGAQEENMFRRTDCHFNIIPKKHTQIKEREIYRKYYSNLINGKNDIVKLDLVSRVCIKSKENPEGVKNLMDAKDFDWSNLKWKKDIGYELLEDNDIFPFLELVSAALNIKNKNFNKNIIENECKKRIDAQFKTLKFNNIKNVVLSAFGCGAFGNPPELVAKTYLDTILKYSELGYNPRIVFAIFYPGYGINNYEVFYRTFKDYFGNNIGFLLPL